MHICSTLPQFAIIVYNMLLVIRKGILYACCIHSNPYNFNTVNICLIMSTVHANKICLNLIFKRTQLAFTGLVASILWCGYKLAPGLKTIED